MQERRMRGDSWAVLLAKAILILLVTAVGLYLLLPFAGFTISRDTTTVVAVQGSEIEHLDRAAHLPPDPQPKNIIVIIADGIGFAHLAAGRTYLHGLGGAATWDRFSATGWHRSHPARGFIVDSASAATALATGVPTQNGFVGMDSEGSSIENLFERAADRGYRIGSITDSYVWDATPAAFASHAPSRDAAESILRQLAHSDVEVLVGELEDVGEQDVPDWDTSLQILEQRFRIYGPDLESTDIFLEEADAGPPIAAIYEEDQLTDLASTPALPPFIEIALERLSSDGRPFLLLIESEEPDTASHRQDFERLLKGLEVVDAAIELALDFSANDGETLVVFTGDHETGGLALTREKGEISTMKALWPTSGHTGTVVPVFATGPGSEHFAGSHSTWEIGRLLASMLRDPISPEDLDLP